MRATLNQASVDVWEHRQLCRGNHARGAGAHNEHIHFIGKFVCAVHAVSLGGQDAWIFRYVAIVVKLHVRSEEHTSELQSRGHLVCRLLLEKKKTLIYS